MITYYVKNVTITDSTDNISGLRGKGQAFYDKVKDSITDLSMILKFYTALYGEAQGIFEFQKNYRLLHMLTTQEDFMREVGVLPELPNIIEIINETTVMENNELNELFK